MEQIHRPSTKQEATLLHNVINWVVLHRPQVPTTANGINVYADKTQQLKVSTDRSRTNPRILQERPRRCKGCLGVSNHIEQYQQQAPTQARQ